MAIHLAHTHHITTQDPVLSQLFGISNNGVTSMGSTLVEVKETPSNLVLVTPTGRPTNQVPQPIGLSMAVPTDRRPMPPMLQPLDLSVRSQGDVQGGPYLDPPTRPASTLPMEDSCKSPRGLEEGQADLKESMETVDNQLVGDGLEPSTESLIPFLESLNKDQRLFEFDEEHRAVPRVLFSSGTQGLATTPPTRVTPMAMRSQGGGHWTVFPGGTPSTPQPIPVPAPLRGGGAGVTRSRAWTPRPGRKPQGPDGTFKSSEPQRRATRAYLARKPTLTMQCSGLQAQVDSLKEQLTNAVARITALEEQCDEGLRNQLPKANERIDELEDFCTQAATLLKIE